VGHDRKSTNRGGSWTIGPTNPGGVYALAVHPSAPATLYAGTSGGGGVFKSTNAGGSWTAINTGLTSSYISALAIDPSAPATLYAGAYGGGVFKSSIIREAHP
jgi:hypothetical protein